MPPSASPSLPSSASTLIRGARLVPVGDAPAPRSAEVDIRIAQGRVLEVARRLGSSTDEEEVIEAGGRWAVPGLWDQHVHFSQWAQSRHRLDVSATSHPSQVVRLVRDQVAQLPPGATATLLVGHGFRSAAWDAQPTVAELDAVTGSRPVVLISGDGHNGWLNSAALAAFGLPPRDAPLDENEWFAIFARLSDLPETRIGRDDAVREAVAEAASRGVVGIVDMELAPNYLDWPMRFAAGINQLRVRTATYPDRLEDVVAARLRSGDDLPVGGGLITMGPLKIISDGSLNTLTANCCDPYLNAAGLEFPYGKQNHSRDDLVTLLGQARACGLEVALHAIGDAAVGTALDAFAATGAVGGIEHAQLVTLDDLPRMAALGVRASVQPAHLLDDRDVVEHYWSDRARRCFAFRSMAQAGVTLALGSDAPVAALDPWLAMAAAVHRSGDHREPWNAAEALTVAQALAASTDGQTTIAAGSRGDVVLLDADPLTPLSSTAAAAEHLQNLQVAATVVAGWPTFLAL
ncbi:MAG TPA: amidohydrolase family protein [Propionibacteriaceae bacterium]|nr:amidohydrolase family protein [Propionibacteriaceae bacterium]